MTSATPQEPKRPWVAEWAVSESFWRDVVSRSLSGLIVLVIGALVTYLVTWFVTLPEEVAAPLREAALLTLVSLVGAVLGTTLTTVAARRRRRHRGEKPNWGGDLVVALLVGAFATVAGAFFAAWISGL